MEAAVKQGISAVHHTNNGDAHKAWYLIYSKPRQEVVAQENLQRQGYTTYLPLTRQPRRRNGKRILLTEPFFPRYLFIQLNTSTDNWAPIRSTFGVSTLVRFGFVPAQVPDRFIEELKYRESDKGIHVQPDDIVAGMKVRIEDGPMLGYEGVFLAKTGNDRAMILLDILGKQARVQVETVSLAVSS